MLPKYVLSRLPGQTIVLGFVEWSDFLPSQDATWSIKPLYISQVANPDQFRMRRIIHQNFYDIKWRISNEGVIPLTEQEISMEIKRIEPLARIDDLTSLLKVESGSIYHTWEASQMIPESNISADWYQRIIEILGEIGSTTSLKIAEIDPWLIGSRIYIEDEISETTDFDIALLCNPEVSLQIRRSISRLRLSSKQYTPQDPYFAFPFRIQVGRCAIDFFPCIPEDVPHPLKGVMEWIPESSSRWRECQVIDASLSFYSLPTLRVTGSPEYVVLCSNGFRGSVLVGDTLQLKVRRTRLISLHDDICVDLACNPWHDVANAHSLFDYTRDRLWV